MREECKGKLRRRLKTDILMASTEWATHPCTSCLATNIYYMPTFAVTLRVLPAATSWPNGHHICCISMYHCLWQVQSSLPQGVAEYSQLAWHLKP